jgi:hypothetical protein
MESPCSRRHRGIAGSWKSHADRFLIAIEPLEAIVHDLVAAVVEDAT